MSGGYTLTVHIGAQSYSLQANGYNVIGDVNLGAAPVQRHETRGAQQHGSTDRGRTLRARNFGLTFKADGQTFRGYWDIRDELIRVFKSTEALYELRFTFGNGDVRSIDCNRSGGLTYPSNRRSAFSDRPTVEFRAPDPTFYDPNEQSETYGIGGGGDAFEIPLAIPWEIGSSVIDITKSIAYGGSWQAYPIITINGPITNCVISNLTTSEVLDFTGTTIGVGDYYEIDTRYGHKTVIDSSGVSQQADLTDDSDLGTFHLEPPVLDDATRDNDIQVTGSGVTEATEVYLRFKVRYEGI